jgi:hypothetical protein
MKAAGEREARVTLALPVRHAQVSCVRAPAQTLEALLNLTARRAPVSVAAVAVVTLLIAKPLAITAHVGR